MAIPNVATTDELGRVLPYLETAQAQASAVSWGATVAGDVATTAASASDIPPTPYLHEVESKVSFQNQGTGRLAPAVESARVERKFDFTGKPASGVAGKPIARGEHDTLTELSKVSPNTTSR